MATKEQLNILLDPELKKQINQIMRTHKLRKRSEAIRKAVAETVTRLSLSPPHKSLRTSLGIGLILGKLDKIHTLPTHDDLWS